ncbi:MAG: pitrilysin family protein [Candidatus Eisenbacteria bacterium]
MYFKKHSAHGRVLAGLRIAIACGALAAVASASSATPARSADKPRKRAVASATPATGLENLEKQVQEFTLPNGLRFILVERHDTPIFSFETRVNTGGAQELPGITGIAHMMEHMAFKGTERVGTSDYAAEAPLLAAEEKAWQAVLDERRKGARADSARLRAATAAYQEARDKARVPVVSNGFNTLLEQNGAVGINAQTSSDWTRYFYSIPSNRLELWGVLEGSRLAHPVFREFYKERDVVYEERRMRTESTPVGRLIEQFLQAAYTNHPYGYGVIGFPSDLSSFTRTQGEEFYRKYYVAKNMAVSVVGDVKLADLKNNAEKYWSDVSSAPPPPELDVWEPEQKAERRVLLEDTAQPYVVIGWHCPAETDPTYPAYEALGDLLGGGTHARLHKLLVKEKKIAVAVGAGPGLFGAKYPSLFLAFAVPAAGQDPLMVEQELYKALAEIQKEKPFTEEELAGYRVRTRASLVAQAEGNESLAEALVTAQIAFGDWRAFFRQAERAQSIQPAEVMAAMKKALVRGNRTVAVIIPPQPETASAEGGH